MHAWPETLFPIASALLLAFAALSAIDGVYIHLFRLKLHARAASWREHVWHTGRAVLFVPIVLSVFGVVSGGPLLWAGIALVAVDLALEVLDMASERGSRREIGGLGSVEYVLHGALITLRTAALALSLAARPASAYALDAPSVISALPGPWAFLVAQLVPGAVVLAAVHVWLAVRHRHHCGCAT
jgi:hypothetical protein